MKKALAILLGMVLVFSMVCGVSAQDIDETSQDQHYSTLVTFTISQGYTVTIPDLIKLNPNEGRGTGDIKVDIDQILADSYLNVVIQTEGQYFNSSSHNWRMMLNPDDPADGSIEFHVGVGRTVNDHIDNVLTSPLEPGYGVMSVSANQKDLHEVKIHCKIPNYDSTALDKNHAGEYKGSLKFVVSIDESNAKATNTGYVFEEDHVIDYARAGGLKYYYNGDPYPSTP